MVNSKNRQIQINNNLTDTDKYWQIAVAYDKNNPYGDQSKNCICFKIFEKNINYY